MGTMRDWREVFAKLVRVGQTDKPKPFPLSIYHALPPVKIVWPENLVDSLVIREFYSVCNGGHFGEFYQWISIEELVPNNVRWVKALTDYDERGNVLDPKQHLVFATDSAGAPVIWDAETDQVRTFWAKGGDWEPVLAFSMDEFLTNLVSSSDDAMWQQAPEQLDTL